MWRRMREDDLAAVGAISDAVHGRYTEPLSIYAERLTIYPDGCFMAECDAGPVGYLVTHPWHRFSPPPLGALLGSVQDDADSYYLHDLALLPMARGTGAGGSATALALDCARTGGFAEIFLVAVAGADAFWTSRGFVATGSETLAAKLHRDYGPEAVYMRREVGMA